MIDPEKVTNFKQTDKQLEEFILFWICAAGKNGRTAARCLDKFLADQVAMYQNNTPFAAILKADSLYNLPELMKYCGIGCYTIKAKAFVELARAGLDLRTCTVTDLESVFGIGPKTARCFLLHSRKNARVSGLDTHLLKHLRSLGYDAPKSTPSSMKKYLDLEKIVLMLSDKAKMTPAAFDLMVWNKYSVKSTPGGK
jgi:thermostable 8-oxoguanine DNA glycosylase